MPDPSFPVGHGLVSVPGSPYTAELLGSPLAGVSGDPYPFRLVVAFGLAVYHGRVREGLARDDIDLRELQALGNRLERYA